MRRTALLLLAAALALGGCFGRHERAPETGPLYSPNGEPLSGGPLGRPGCDVAMARWFDRLDANHDGAIGRAAFLADARRQFAVMDLDKDGVLVPAELAQYRAPYIATFPMREAEAAPEPESRGRRGGGGGRDTPMAEDRADPVMIADVDLHNRVTLPEFLAYASRNFAGLDANHDGRLSRDEALATCKGRS